ncbi:acyltransferase family protein [Chitinophaga rhizophila]|uniref:Acyltransferase n=1 Tax=Chitinophaga rhizophila TaxID=2866212 RepID=A0ABS7GCM9_9BACT|nr:acyltransferase [Chitinophaga rhizophila]MBW8684905.1 acyltransferase [Chitinophaga rhizophila]
MSQPLSAGKHLAGLDHLRAFAITFVFLYHYRIFQHPEWIDTIGAFGWTGVDLFFVLSGFLIASQLFEQIDRHEHLSFRTFFIKRFFRIIPAYLAVLSLYFLLPVFREKEALPPLWKLLTFTQNLGLNLKERGTFSHAWSLCIEEQFYFLFPIILIMLVRWKALKLGPWLIASLFLAGFAIRIWCWFELVSPAQDTNHYWVTWYMWMYYPTFTRLDGLLTGVTLAAVFVFLPNVKRQLIARGNMMLLAGLLILMACWWSFVDNPTTFTASVFGFPLIALGYGTIVAGAVSKNSFLDKYKLSFTATLAALSYAIYLSHKGVIHLTQMALTDIGIEADSTLSFFICTISCILSAFLLRMIVEKPFLQIRNKLLGKAYRSSSQQSLSSSQTQPHTSQLHSDN